MLCCGGRMTEHVSDSSAQCLRFTREFGSGCSVVCLISCRYSSHSNDSFRIDLSMTFCISVTCSSSALRTTSPKRIEEQSTVTQRNPIYATTVGKPLHLKRGYPYRFAPVQRISILSGTSARRSVRLVRTTGSDSEQWVVCWKTNKSPRSPCTFPRVRTTIQCVRPTAFPTCVCSTCEHRNSIVLLFADRLSTVNYD